ncbi:sushi, von Willebrand factor type A, EGF and pentraxin domain-containing protein 1-like [Mercenaria mercenaria]|uniref:sushi, von Willebrand factor type A, EGF and pentraxin domain-containing protein 1-like n=1 Tax=Mercenaria mercenaria TaxID=6596 RepID=UPI00234E878F|nr:sushi, von Willebrand factor type A, EGF and pentraxin domain-containing protein 1-like [Mercenaria mercenaria]
MDKPQKSNKNITGNTFELKDVTPEQSLEDDVTGTYETLDAFPSNFTTAIAEQSIYRRCETADSHDLHLIPNDKSNRRKLVYTVAILGFVAILLAALAVVVVFLSSRNNGATASNENRCLEYSLSNGKVVNATGFRAGDTLQVECNSASKLVGSAKITCHSTGHWSDYPRCIPKECNDFEAPRNGGITLKNKTTNIGATVLVKCAEGFVRKGGETVVCQSNETWSDRPTCEPVDCKFPNRIENGEIRNMTGTTYHNTFIVVCSLGYRLTGVSTVVCELSGMWSEFPLCKSILCGIPGIPKNGLIKSLNGTRFSSTAILQCDEGFVMSGNPTISCTVNGSWTALPTCERNDNKHGLNCGALLSVENGEIRHLTGTRVNGTYSVRCFKGYNLKGNRTVICGEDGTWSDMPACMPVSCGSPHVPSDGYVVSTNGTTFKASARISCKNGYSVNGNQDIRCMESGQWTATPVCERKDCGVPSNVKNGKIKGLTGTKYNDSFSVECIDDNILVGQETVKCDTNGNWTKIPVCIAQPNCGVPPSINNGEIIGVTDTNIFYVNCNSGYRLTGENTLRCDLNAKWTTSPNCELIDCGTPNLTHGSIIGLLNTSYDNLLSVSCNEGYSLIGTNTITCGEDGKWKNVPSCELVTCELPEIPINGAVDTLEGTKVNNTVSFQCNPGFHLNGTRIIMCSGDGKWTEGPTCLPDCGDPPRIENGTVSRNSSDSMLSVQCNNGYILNIDNVIKCASNGKWTALPSCDPVSCGIPEIPRNGMLLTISGTKFNALATMKCDEGFSLTGNSVIICLNNGSWTLNPRCIQIDCRTPKIANGNIIGSNESTNATFGSTIHVTCNKGYSLVGSDTIQCGIGGHWNTIPTCELVTCGLPEIPVNGAIASIQETTFNITVSIKCHSGYVLNGTGLVTCSNHGNWTQSPTCIPDCGSPPNITNGKITGLTNRGNIFSVLCNYGYSLTGNSAVRCDAYGKWTKIPVCYPASCGIPEIPKHRKLISLSGTRFESTAHMGCDEGYLMAGSSLITCLRNGSWTWIPACEPLDCGTPKVENGVIRGYTASTYRSTVYVTCNEGYTLIGMNEVQCGIDGQWSLPICILSSCGLPNIPENGAIDSMNGTTLNRTATIVCHPGFLLNGTNIVTCHSHGKWTKSPTCTPVSDCYDIHLESNKSISGIHNVTLWKSKSKIKVYCDMDTDGGGWTVFQNRFDGSVAFYNTYAEYEYGFGNLSTEFWLGLKYIHEMSEQSKTELRIDLSAADGSTAYDTFQNFSLGSQLYRLSASKSTDTTGNSGTALSYYGGAAFSTRDRDFDGQQYRNCAHEFQGAWWYSSPTCSYVNLNGEYLSPGTKVVRNLKRGMFYLKFKDESLKSSKMMFRRVKKSM